jgi:8-oxo-dGTP pyrophosphatase MutT (NUDIX family)
VLDFDSKRDPVVPRDAATVMVIRPAEARDGIQVFCVQRHVRSGFMGGAIVFPGGKVDASDYAPAWADRATPLTERARALAELESTARAFAIAALRELLEEAAMLPVIGGALDSEGALALRRGLAGRVAAGEPASVVLLELCAARGLSVDAARLEAFARWVTPTAETRRYDTRFYLLAAPEGQSGQHDEHETTTSFWRAPEEVLELWMQGKIFLAPPTARTLQLLSPAQSVEQALAIARMQSLDPVCPFFAQEGDRVLLALPGDPLYPEPHPEPTDPRAPTRFVLEDGRFVPRRAG